MVILKQKKENVFIVEVKNMEDLLVMNVDMSKKILYVKIVFLFMIILIS